MISQLKKLILDKFDGIQGSLLSSGSLNKEASQGKKEKKKDWEN